MRMGNPSPASRNPMDDGNLENWEIGLSTHIQNSNGVDLALLQLRIQMISRLQLVAHRSKIACDHPVPPKLPVWPMEVAQLQGGPNPRVQKIQKLGVNPAKRTSPLQKKLNGPSLSPIKKSGAEGKKTPNGTMSTKK
ncbi:hypothetical protein U9M48_035181 [Paspalum notatum var. saurae]|uniref:Uncharacterized protein n=1 Tax=Paspalum notatum var. saurae TaxID=547442 RepID=A0AAQ3X852_PASNO